MRKFTFGFILVLVAGFAAVLNTTQASEKPLSFNSGDKQVALLELYTSEGCSSCPPAEAWLSKLKDDPNLWQSIVPIAFHVDYWNYLGWKDPLSRSESSLRQRRYKEQGGVDSVYTPGFVLNGNEWRGWYSGKPVPRTNSSAGVLAVKVENGKLEVAYRNKKGNKEHLDLQVALLGFNIATEVAGGENRGRELIHQFSVLAHSAKRSSSNRWTLPTPQSDIEAESLALAVWVTKPNSQQPLQATGGWLEQVRSR